MSVERAHQHSFPPIIRYHHGWELIVGYRPCRFCGKEYRGYVLDPRENAKAVAAKARKEQGK